MTLTRLGFFKLLAAVGIGQSVLKAGPDQDTPRWKVIKRADGTDCRPYDYVGADKDGNYVCIPEQCEPKPGESRCPLGHCQKPRLLFDLGDGEHCYVRQTDPEAMQHLSDAERSAGIWKFKPCTKTSDTLVNACSTCGIVYVPPATKGKG